MDNFYNWRVFIIYSFACFWSEKYNLIFFIDLVGVGSFKEIMDEELALELSRKANVRLRIPRYNIIDSSNCLKILRYI